MIAAERALSPNISMALICLLLAWWLVHRIMAALEAREQAKRAAFRAHMLHLVIVREEAAKRDRLEEIRQLEELYARPTFYDQDQAS